MTSVDFFAMFSNKDDEHIDSDERDTLYKLTMLSFSLLQLQNNQLI